MKIFVVESVAWRLLNVEAPYHIAPVKVVANHLADARWMSRVGYRYRAAGQHPGAERGQASQLDPLRSLGVMTTPPDGRTGR